MPESFFYLLKVILSTAEALTDYKPAVIDATTIADKIAALGFNTRVKSGQQNMNSASQNDRRSFKHVQFDVKGICRMIILGVCFGMLMWLCFKTLVGSRVFLKKIPFSMCIEIRSCTRVDCNY